MNQSDVYQIRAMIPCLMNIIEHRMGYLVDTCEVYLNKSWSKYSHVLRLTVLNRNWDYDIALDSVGINLFLGRKNGKLIYKFSRFDYIPAPEFKRASFSMYDRVENEFDTWWWSTEFVLASRYYIGKQVAAFKHELFMKTVKQEQSDNTEVPI